MKYIEGSEQLTGYRVRTWRRDAFTVRGYTMVGPSGKIPSFWSEVEADGRLGKLIAASSVPPWVLGLGSWDPECPKRGQRYTICIEETEHTDFAALAEEHSLFTKHIGASDWMCFELPPAEPRDFWKDNPYKMMGPLGYQFHSAEGDYSVGLHFDAYPPGHDKTNPRMEFWITVVEAQG